MIGVARGAIRCTDMGTTTAILPFVINLIVSLLFYGAAIAAVVLAVLLWREMRRLRASGLNASSVPELGQLYPITQELFVNKTNGRVGLGTADTIGIRDSSWSFTTSRARRDGGSPNGIRSLRSV